MTVVCQLTSEASVLKYVPRHRKIAKLLQTDAKIFHKDLETVTEKCLAPKDQLIDLLKIFNILLPAARINVKKEFSPPPDSTSTPKGKQANDPDDILYVIPSLLQDVDLDSDWALACDSTGERVFYVDFYEFVPVAVFHQLLVQAAALSVSSDSFEPRLSRFDGIFGLNNSFAYRLQYIESQCQVKGRLRLATYLLVLIFSNIYNIQFNNINN